MSYGRVVEGEGAGGRVELGEGCEDGELIWPSALSSWVGEGRETYKSCAQYGTERGRHVNTLAKDKVIGKWRDFI